MRRNILPIGAVITAALWPIADILAANGAAAVPPKEGFEWALGLIVAGLIAAAAVTFLVGTFRRGATIVAPLMVCFFGYAALEPLLGKLVGLMGLHNGRPFLYAVVFGAFAIWLLKSSTQALTQRWALMAPIAFLASSCVLAALAGGWTTPHAVAREMPKLSASGNVYHFLFDGLARPEVLKSKLDLTVIDSNAAFSRLGFVVPEHVVAAYPWTTESVSSILNLGAAPGPGEKFRVESSAVVQEFRRSGYHYGRYGEVFASLVCSGDEDVCVSTKSGLSEFDTTMLRRTPIYPAVRRRLASSTSSRTLPSNLRRIAETRLPQPTYFFSYMVPPHPPYFFSKACKAEGNNSDFRTWGKVGIERYGYAYNCTISAMLRAAKTIEQRDPTAIIIVSGDHGTMFKHAGPARGAWPIAAREERFPVFLAIRGPARCHLSFAHITYLPKLYPAVFACLQRPSAPRTTSSPNVSS